MFGHVPLRGVNEDRRAVKRAQIPFNDTNNDEQAGVSTDGFNPRYSVRMWDLDSGRMVAKVFVSAFRSAIPDGDAK